MDEATISVQDFLQKREMDYPENDCRVEAGEYRVRVQKVALEKYYKGQSLVWTLCILGPVYEGCTIRKRHCISDSSHLMWQLRYDLGLCGLALGMAKELEDPKRLELLQNSVLLIEIEDSWVGRLIHFTRCLSRTNPLPYEGEM